MKQADNLVSVEIAGQDRITYETDSTGKNELQVKCCYQLSKKIEEYSLQHGADPKLWPLPTSNDHADVLLRLFVRKINQSYQNPYPHEEVCHCRSVSAVTVEKAIINGAHSVETLALWTSAGTACGTCRVDSQKILDSLLV